MKVKPEQYVLCFENEILAVFQTLQECLQWVPNRYLPDSDLIAWRFYTDENAEIQKQKITISGRIFARNTLKKLQEISTAVAESLGPHSI